MKKIILSFLILSVSCLVLSAQQAKSKNDVTEKLEKLGNPYAEKYRAGASIYARNIWTVFAYNGKIYLGAGNSSNEGPASNAGPVPLISFDPVSKKFETEWTVPDEQIDTYHVFSDGCLYTPGHDPKEDWKLGNFYRKKKDGQWEKVRSLPDGVHNYDMAEFDGKLFAAGYGIGVSSDNGTTFNLLKQDFKRGLIDRCYSLLPFKKSLVAVTAFSKGGRGKGRAFVGVYNTKKNDFERIDMSYSDIMPKTDLDQTRHCKIMRPTPFKNDAIYIGGYIHNDHQTMPMAAYSASPAGKGFKAKRIDLGKNAVPWDIKARNGKILILTATPDEDGGTINEIWMSNDGKTARKLFFFKATTFARSFEYLDGFFYFGMGCEIADPKKWKQDELKEECGEIYRAEWKI